MSPPLDDAVQSSIANVALDDIDVSDPRLYQDDTWYPYFARLRREAPVHYCRSEPYGPYWSVTKYKDIMQGGDQPPNLFFGLGARRHRGRGSAQGHGPPELYPMDPPNHDEQRIVVSPAVSPGNLANMEGLIRERTARVLEACRAARRSTGSIACRSS